MSQHQNAAGAKRIGRPPLTPEQRDAKPIRTTLSITEEAAAAFRDHAARLVIETGRYFNTSEVLMLLLSRDRT
jgi:hypothetical protein